MRTNKSYLLAVFAVLVLLVLADKSYADPVQLTRIGDSISINIGGRPFSTYYFGRDYSKSFLQPLRDPKGIVVTRDIPVGNAIPPEHRHDPALEPHQRGLYFAHGDINGSSFWIEQVFSQYYTQAPHPAYGHMVFRKLDEMTSGGSMGAIRASFDLEGPENKPFAQETQYLRFSGDKDTRIIDCEFVIKAGNQPVHFGDTKEGTLGIRLATALDAPNGTMVNSEGGSGEKQVWGKRANWVNVDGTIQGQKLGVAVFDSPDSFRHPTYWHARGYGLLAANPFGLSYFENDPKKSGAYTLPAGQSVKFHYRVLIHDGTYQDAHIAERYAAYVAHP